jgi:formamidopyrimidine-DNA glycosylase
MVEGPQTSYLANQIRKRFKNKTLQTAQIIKGRYRKHSLKGWKEFVNSGPHKLNDVMKKGKVLFLFFVEGWAIIVRFGMTGWFYFDPKNIDGDIIFEFDKGKTLIFYDPRHFGTLTLTKNVDDVLREMESIAPDILDLTVSFKDIKDRIPQVNPNFTLDKVLMDQKLILSGIGNIIKSEVMYDAMISPQRKIKDISEKEWKKIFSSARKISNQVFKEIQNDSEDEFFKIQKIYQREKDPKGNPVEKFESSDGRVTFWVPNVQK